MENIYVFGHRNPDTDSVCGAIALSYLKRQLGFRTIPAILSNINNDFKDNILNNKIKDFLISEIKKTIKLKTLGMCLKGIKCDVIVLKNGIKINDKTFRLKNNDYDTLETKTLDYIETLKHQ